MGSQKRRPDADPGRPGPRSITALLTDDDQSVLRSLTRGLKPHGIEVLTAGSAATALALLADPSVSIDVLVMDMVLPDSWGSDVAMEGRVHRPQIPVIYISGRVAGDPIFAASRVGDDLPFLEKPFTPDQLAALIRRVVEEDSAPRE